MLLFIGLGRSLHEDATLHCAACGQLISCVREICRIMGRPPRKAYTNPAGMVYPILTLASAQELTVDAVSCLEHTWFSGYAWRAVSCGACGLFLGWTFEAESDAGPDLFYGLLEERLISGDPPCVVKEG